MHTKIPSRTTFFISAAAAVIIIEVLILGIFSPSSSSEQASAAIELVDARWLVRYQDRAAEIAKLQKEIRELKEKYAKCNNVNDEEAIVKELFDAVNPAKLLQLSTKFNGTYASAQPFPHIAIDDLFPSSIIEKIIGEHPESILKDGCIPGTERCYDSPEENKKSSINTDERMGTYTRILFSFLKSSTFTKFLEDLSGISNLLPDPHFHGSGLHFTASGGSLDIHADFNRHPDNNLDRRVNVFIYLNDDWPEEYGGHLELWSKDMQSCYQRIQPKLGRFVVFSSTDFSYHGHPEPIQAPDGRARRSIALYYYTNGRPSDECLDNDCSGQGHSDTFFKSLWDVKSVLMIPAGKTIQSGSPVWLAI
ncbi:hypothetical protein ACHAWO_009101 [Cyclotella atomus]|uniref:Prolyl 4-hydroxylase alpha subunit domain-containing protein n=1 Tax=Cyclotella atomus TaxID=382360 RepID=A0ABD3N5R1_9STRA